MLVLMMNMTFVVFVALGVGLVWIFWKFCNQEKWWKMLGVLPTIIAIIIWSKLLTPYLVAMDLLTPRLKELQIAWGL